MMRVLDDAGGCRLVRGRLWTLAPEDLLVLACEIGWTLLVPSGRRGSFDSVPGSLVGEALLALVVVAMLLSLPGR